MSRSVTHKPMLARAPYLSIPPVTRGPSDQLVGLFVETVPCGEHVNDNVPDALEGENDCAGEIEWVVRTHWIHEGVDAVDA